MKKEIRRDEYYCDLCGKRDDDSYHLNLPVWFTSDQTEGRPCEPYISNEEIDVCNECIKKVITVTGCGAQGYNDFKLIEK